MQNVKLQLEDVLKEQDKTMYWLAKQTGTTYATIHKLAKDDVQYVKLEILDKICIALNCTPNDILPIRPALSKS